MRSSSSKDAHSRASRVTKIKRLPKSARAKDDFYVLMGITRKTPPAAIRKAYAKLVRKYHPDVNPDEEDSLKKYRAITEAYNVLSDPDKRKEYDTIGHTAYISRAAPRAAAGLTGSDSQLGAPSEAETDILDDILTGTLRKKHLSLKGGDTEQVLELTFLETVKGATKTLKVNQDVPCPKCRKTKRKKIITEPCDQCGGSGVQKVTRALNVTVPPGIRENQKLRVKGAGLPGPQGASYGDLYLTPAIKRHPYFWRQGSDLFLELPISCYEACLGARISVPTIDGWVLLTVPAGIQNGRKLRLKAKGISSGKKKGDQYVVIKIMAPEAVDPEERTTLEQLQLKYPHDPRKELNWEAHLI